MFIRKPVRLVSGEKLTTSSTSALSEQRSKYEREVFSLRGELVASEAQVGKARAEAAAEAKQLRAVASAAQVEVKVARDALHDTVTRSRNQLVRVRTQSAAQAEDMGVIMNRVTEGHKQELASLSEQAKGQAAALELRTQALEAELQRANAAKGAAEAEARRLAEQALHTKQQNTQLVQALDSANREKDRSAQQVQTLEQQARGLHAAAYQAQAEVKKERQASFTAEEMHKQRLAALESRLVSAQHQAEMRSSTLEAQVADTQHKAVQLSALTKTKAADQLQNSVDSSRRNSPRCVGLTPSYTSTTPRSGVTPRTTPMLIAREASGTRVSVPPGPPNSAAVSTSPMGAAVSPHGVAAAFSPMGVAALSPMGAAHSPMGVAALSPVGAGTSPTGKADFGHRFIQQHPSCSSPAPPQYEAKEQKAVPLAKETASTERKLVMEVGSSDASGKLQTSLNEAKAELQKTQEQLAAVQKEAQQASEKARLQSEAAKAEELALSGRLQEALQAKEELCDKLGKAQAEASALLERNGSLEASTQKFAEEEQRLKACLKEAETAKEVAEEGQRTLSKRLQQASRDRDCLIEMTNELRAELRRWRSSQS